MAKYDLTFIEEEVSQMRPIGDGMSEDQAIVITSGLRNALRSLKEVNEEGKAWDLEITELLNLENSIEELFHRFDDIFDEVF